MGKKKKPEGMGKVRVVFQVARFGVPDDDGNVIMPNALKLTPGAPMYMDVGGKALQVGKMDKTTEIDGGVWVEGTIDGNTARLLQMLGDGRANLMPSFVSSSNGENLSMMSVDIVPANPDFPAEIVSEEASDVPSTIEDCGCNPDI